MHPVDAALIRSARPPFELELPDALADAITEVWADVEQLASPSLAAAHAWFTAELPVIAAGRLSPSQLLRLALLTLGELGLDERRDYAPRVAAQPWFRAYDLLANATRDPAALAGLARPLRWLVVDAVLDACEFDSRGNAMQLATGWLSACWRIERDAGLDLEPTLRRMWWLAARGFAADGYDDGSFELTFDGLADGVDDPALAAQLRLVHAFMDYASADSEPHARRQLAAALTGAVELGLDVEGLRELCLPIIGSWFEGELPLRPADLRER